MKYITLIILWFIWCFIHSGMISVTAVRYLKLKLGTCFRFYRLFYNTVAFITLVPLIIYTQSLKENILFTWEGYLQFVRFFLFAVSIMLFIAGAQKYDLLEFTGIRQIVSGKINTALSENGKIVTSGILGFTRHPWYSGAIVFVWTCYRNMYVYTLIVNIIITIYLVLGALLEERKLILEFGDSYRVYKKRVSMLFPFKQFLLKKNK